MTVRRSIPGWAYCDYCQKPGQESNKRKEKSAMNNIIDEINSLVDTGEFQEEQDGVLAMTKKDGHVEIAFKGSIDVFSDMLGEFLDAYSEQTGVEQSMIIYALLDKMGYIEAPESQQVS